MTRRTVIFGAIGTVLILAIWYLALWAPRQSAAAKEKKRHDEAQVQLDDLSTRLARLKALKKNEAKRMAEMEKLRIAVPDKPNLAHFIIDANKAADDSGVDFLTISPSSPAAGGAESPAHVNLSMTVAGPYADVLHYLNRLQELKRVVVIDSLSLSPAGDPGPETTTRLGVSLSARMFSATIGDVAPPAAATTPGATGATPAPAAAAPGAAPATASPAPATTPGAP